MKKDEPQQTISLIYESYLCCKNLLSKFYLCLFEANTACILLHTQYSSNSTHNTSHMQFLLFSFFIFLNVFFTWQSFVSAHQSMWRIKQAFILRDTIRYYQANFYARSLNSMVYMTTKATFWAPLTINCLPSLQSKSVQQKFICYHTTYKGQKKFI